MSQTLSVTEFELPQMQERVKGRATFNPFASHELYHMTLELVSYQQLGVLSKETREWK